MLSQDHGSEHQFHFVHVHNEPISTRNQIISHRVQHRNVDNIVCKKKLLGSFLNLGS